MGSSDISRTEERPKARAALGARHMETGARPAEPVVVKVELYGVIRDLVKESNLEVRLPDGRHVSYRDILGDLTERFGPAFRERLFDHQGRLLSFVKILAGGNPINDLDQTLPVGEEPAVRIIVLAAAGGG